MKKVWIRRFGSFREAEEFDIDYYLNMKPSERLDTIQYLRDVYYKIKGVKNAGRKRLRRVVKGI